MANEIVGLVGRLLGEHEDRCVDAGIAQFRALLDQRDAQTAGTRVEGGAGDLHCPVAVAVRLHHGPDRGRRRRTPEEGDVVNDCGPVDLGPGPAT